MRRVLLILNCLMAIGGLVLLWLSIWPGYATWIFVTCVVIGYGVLGIGWLITVFVLLRRKGRGVVGVLVGPVMVLATWALLRVYVPRRVAFALCRSGFERHLTRTPSPASPTQCDRRIGWYHVDLWARDSRGGIYFRTGSGPDGIGPDRTSAGFVYQPNGGGTPFGSARYRLGRLGNDWFWFCASDDWD